MVRIAFSNRLNASGPSIISGKCVFVASVYLLARLSGKNIVCLVEVKNKAGRTGSTFSPCPPR